MTLEEGELQAIGVLKAHVAVAPGRNDGRVDHNGSFGKETSNSGIQIGDLKGEADLAADTPLGFNLIDGFGLGFIEEFEGGLAHFDDHRPTLTVGPELGGFEAETVAVEAHETFIVLGGDGDAHFEDGARVV
jgi:hypothetical protein